VYPLWTLFKAGEYLLDVSLVAAIVTAIHSAEDYKTFLDWTWTLFGVELIWVWTQVMLWPRDALEDGRLRGVFPATAYNAVGESGAILAIIAFCRLLRRGPRRSNRTWYTYLFVFGLASMLMSQTRNAMAGFVLAFVLVLCLSRHKLSAVFTLAGTGLIASGGLGPMLWAFLKRGQDDNSFASLTGRLDWWTYAWHQFLQHPLTGLGAYAGGKFAVLGKLGFNASSTHSDYVELLVGAGIPGLVLFFIALAGAWVLLFRYLGDRSFSSMEHQLCLESLGVLAIITVHSFFNVELTWHSPMFFLSILGYAEFLRRRKPTQFARAARLSTAHLNWTKAPASS
jgi:O-antigen ligase